LDFVLISQPTVGHTAAKTVLNVNFPLVVLERRFDFAGSPVGVERERRGVNCDQSEIILQLATNVRDVVVTPYLVPETIVMADD
jgi:hypothetical protein